jgi:transposase
MQAWCHVSVPVAARQEHRQKALTEMNIQLANVISDISGTTGMAILRDIIKGERDAEKLAGHKHARISRQSPGDRS